MSVTVDIACHTCKEQLWVGQSDYIYTTQEALVNLKSFLFEHKSHQLEFCDEHADYNYPDKRSFPDEDEV